MTRRSAGEATSGNVPTGRGKRATRPRTAASARCTRRTKREVTDKLREALGEAQDGVLTVDQRLTTAAYLADWLEHDVKPARRPATYRAYEQSVRLYLIPGLGRIPLAKLAPEHVRAMLSRLEGRVGGTTLRYILMVLKVALRRAERHGRVRRNVASLVDPPKVSRKEIAPLSAEQSRTFLEAIESHWMAALFLAAVGTGARQGELLALHWADVDLKSGLAAIRYTLQPGGTVAEPKTDSSRRVVTLPRTVVGALRRHKAAQARQRLAAGSKWQDHDFVFTGHDGSPLDGSSVRRAFHRVLDDAGLPSIPFHHLRHTYATLQLEAGEGLANISKVLGDAKLATTADLYAHLTPQTQSRMDERMDAILTG